MGKYDLICLMFSDEIQEFANQLLYFEMEEMYEQCGKLRDTFTVDAYTWCTLLEKDGKLCNNEYNVMMESFEKSFDKNLLIIRKKYFV